VTKRDRTGRAGRATNSSAPAETPSSNLKPAAGGSERFPSSQRSVASQEVPVTPLSPASVRRSRNLLVIAAVLAAAWMVAILLLAHYTANPVTLNREQILDSPYVVTATVLGDPASGQVSVEREWKKQSLSGTIDVANLSATGVKAGLTYILPLSKPDQSLQVTEAPNSNGTALVYPATPEALDQLKSIVDYQAKLRNQP
jgi:hypothetical protein